MTEIYSDLKARHGIVGIDVTKVSRLPENIGVAFMGDTKGGGFDVSGELGRNWLRTPINPNGKPNSEVLRPWVNGLDVTRRHRDMWIIDYGWTTGEDDASFYEAPFAYAQEHVQAPRIARQQRGYGRYWWRHERPRPEMWAALRGLDRYIATPTVAKYRLFVWLSAAVCPGHQLIVTARNDDTTFGVLHSRFHELWALRLGTWLGVGNDPRYTPSTTFETFPFPKRVTPDMPAEAYADEPQAQRIAAAAKRLNELRENWLNPPDLVQRVPEVVPGYPDRILPKDEEAAKALKKRTLTNLYNQRPAWLDNVHKELDAAVAAAYGWPSDLSDDEILERLFALNQERAGNGQPSSATRPAAPARPAAR